MFCWHSITHKFFINFLFSKTLFSIFFPIKSQLCASKHLLLFYLKGVLIDAWKSNSAQGEVIIILICCTFTHIACQQLFDALLVILHTNVYHTLRIRLNLDFFLTRLMHARKKYLKLKSRACVALIHSHISIELYLQQRREIGSLWIKFMW